MAKLTLTALVAVAFGAVSLALSGCGSDLTTREKMSAETNSTAMDAMAGDKMKEHDGMMSGGKMQGDGMHKEGMMAGEKMNDGKMEGARMPEEKMSGKGG
jgi:hypothetical protein